MRFSPFQILRSVGRRVAGTARYALTGSGVETMLRLRGGGSGYVDETTSLQVSAVFACVGVLSRAVASLPLMVMEDLDESGARRTKKAAREHPLYTLLHDAPNPEITSYQFRSYLMANLVLTGNGYALIERKAGRPESLWPIASWRVSPERNANGKMVYRVNQGSTSETYLRGDVFHVPALAWDGDPMIGINPIEAQRRTIGMAIAAHEHGEAFFESGGVGKIGLKSPSVKDEEIRNIQQSWVQNHAGRANWLKPAVMKGGMEITHLQMNNQDLQWLESRRFSVEEIARMFNVPPHMIGDLSRATFNNIEHLSISFVVNTLLPWLVSWEQSIGRQLLLRDDRSKYYAQFKVDGLLRGDTKSRNEALQIQRWNGVLSANEWRELEDKNPLPKSAGGDVYLWPANMMPAVAGGAIGAGGDDDGDDGDGDDGEGGGGIEDIISAIGFRGARGGMRGAALNRAIRQKAAELQGLYAMAEPMGHGAGEAEAERLRQENEGLKRRLAAIEARASVNGHVNGHGN